MDLRPRAALGVRQQLIVTPRMQQALQVLQAPRTELLSLLQGELAENPFLEEEPDALAPPAEPAQADGPPGEEDLRSAVAREECLAALPGVAVSRASWEDRSGSGWIPDRTGHWTAPLVRQFRLEGAPGDDVGIAVYLLGCLDARGYLALPVETAAADLGRDAAQVEGVRRRLMRLDPPGVAALGPAECLRVQLEMAGEGDSLAARVLGFDLELIASGREALLAERLGVTVTDVQAAIGRIRRLWPHPICGAREPGAPPVVPDLRVEQIEGVWEVFPVDLGLPRLRLAPPPPLGPWADAQARVFVAERLARARWLLGSLGARQRTLVRLMRGILEEQAGFFQNGVEALKPLGYSRLAAWMGLHESTVARAVRGKYVETPRGLYPLRFFFGHGLPARGGGTRSTAAVAHLIESFVRAEPPRAPLSDEQIAARLRREGLGLARRTVAKYRERMGIPKAAHRRRA